MTDHLPECPMAEQVYDDRADCICPELRACEQRTLDAAEARLLYAALGYSTDPEFHALAAIRALKEKP